MELSRPASAMEATALNQTPTSLIGCKTYTKTTKIAKVNELLALSNDLTEEISSSISEKQKPFYQRKSKFPRNTIVKEIG